VPEDPFDDDEEGYGAPLPPDDRIWRHPSEVGGLVQAARRRREVSNGRLIGFAAAASLLGSVITVGALALGGAFDRTVVERSSTPTTVTSAPPALLATEGSTWSAVVQRLAPSIARLEGSGEARTSAGAAVAFSNDDDGTYFVTSLDLLDRVERITLVLDGGRQRRADVIASDQYTNLAVVRVAGVRIAPADFGTTVEPQTGDDAIVVGAPPPDTDSPTVAKALIGSVGEGQRSTSGLDIEDLLRTDANIGPESKGGALVDRNGALLGLLVVMRPDETGVERFGYALPARVVTATASSLVDSGFPTEVWLGISGMDLPPATALALGVAGGAVLDNVAVDSPAADCGLTSGDIVTMLNTTPIDSMTRLVLSLRQLQPTDDVAVEYIRTAPSGQPETRHCYTTLSRPPEIINGAGDGIAPTVTAEAPPATPTSTAPPAVTVPTTAGATAGPATTAAGP
jgi:S1-C subfamily serine protease